MAKTSVHLKYAPGIWPLVEKWAVENHFALETQAESSRLYVQKDEQTKSKVHVAISQFGDDIKVDAWFVDPIRKELALDSRSLYSAIPRKEAYSELQKLFGALETNTPRKKKTKKNKKNVAFNLGRSIRKISGKK